MKLNIYIILKNSPIFYQSVLLSDFGGGGYFREGLFFHQFFFCREGLLSEFYGSRGVLVSSRSTDFQQAFYQSNMVSVF